MLATKPDNMDWIPETAGVEEKNGLPKFVLLSSHVL